MSMVRKISFWHKPQLWIVVFSLMLAAAGIAYDVYVQTPPAVPREEATELSDPAHWAEAPDFSFTTLDGVTHHLRDLKDKVVLLNFWATWCVPCKVEFPQMAKLINDYHGKVIMLGLSSDKNEKAIQDFLGKQPSAVQEAVREKNMLIALDKNQDITRKIFLTQMYPETIILSPDQKMAKKIIGITDWDGGDMHAFIDHLLSMPRTQ